MREEIRTIWISKRGYMSSREPGTWTMSKLSSSPGRRVPLDAVLMGAKRRIARGALQVVEAERWQLARVTRSEEVR